MIFSKSKRERVARVSAAFFLIVVPSFSSVADSAFEKEMSEANKLFLAKKRVKAIKKLLNFSMSNEAEARRALTAASRMATLFYQNKSQQHYEKGQAELFSSPERAVEHFKRAAALESNHLKILLGISRAYLYSGQCKKIEEIYEARPWLTRISEDYREILISSSACRKEYNELLDRQDKWKSFWNLRQNRLFVAYRKALSGKPLVKNNLSIDVKLPLKDHHPDVLYWIWRQSEAKPLEVGLAYVSICMGQRAKVRRKHQNSYFFCNRTAEVEKSVKKLSEGDSVL